MGQTGMPGHCDTAKPHRWRRAPADLMAGGGWSAGPPDPRRLYQHCRPEPTPGGGDMGLSSVPHIPAHHAAVPELLGAQWGSAKCWFDAHLAKATWERGASAAVGVHALAMVHAAWVPPRIMRPVQGPTCGPCLLRARHAQSHASGRACSTSCASCGRAAWARNGRNAGGLPSRGACWWSALVGRPAAGRRNDTARAWHSTLHSQPLPSASNVTSPPCGPA
jgi:hypothetical protein